MTYIQTKVLATPELSQKVANLPPSGKAEFNNLLLRLEGADGQPYLNPEQSGAGGHVVGDIYTIVEGRLCVFYAVQRDASGQFLLLLDLVFADVQRTDARFKTQKDPRLNSRYNPLLNSHLNPNLNAHLNPSLNSRINPMLNSKINPALNSAINPALNPRINPWLNSSLNPNLNSTINPLFNSFINPNVNTAYSGPYLYDLSLSLVGFIVWAGDGIALQFANGAQFISYAIPIETGGFVVFDKSNRWIEHWVAADDSVYIRFTEKNQWIGIVV